MSTNTRRRESAVVAGLRAALDKALKENLELRSLLKLKGGAK